ncbi:zf-HC2 domain-containing protein [Nonomuraea sp. NPDC003804]|uniref:anti-sigma factor family protein n=1 Tax=Nonomuraea sp. NPDC003804 TaxID=3154547 RepID=UPI0033AFD9BE
MTCEEVRLSLGAYTLGALDPEEALEVEVHLASCEGCTDELMELEGVSSFLAKVSEQDVVLVASPPREVLDRLLNDRVKRHRRTRLLLAVAASVAVLAVGGTVWTGIQQRASQSTAAAPASTQADMGQGAAPEHAGEATKAPKANTPEQPMIAQDLPRADTRAAPSESPSAALKSQGTAFQGSRNGVSATVTVTPGMPLQVQVSGVAADTECTLVVVRKSGGREVTGSWKVRANRYEEGSEVYHVASRTPLAAIRAFEIRDAADRVLVTVDAR